MDQKINPSAHGFLLVDKPKGKTAFNLVSALRRKLHVKTVGHTGTLDPLATGVMLLLMGREYTKHSNSLMAHEKEYLARIHLGIETDTYDAEGQHLALSSHKPTLSDIEQALKAFDGEIMQVPPMFSAKKLAGKKLYELARQGKSVERAAVKLSVACELLSYEYPYVELSVECSKGTYIRSIAHDLGQLLGCGGHLTSLVRTRSGPYVLSDCLDGELLFSSHADLLPYIRRDLSHYEAKGT